MREGKLKFHLMMVFLILAWGLEGSIVTDALASFSTFVVLNVKYLCGSIFIFVFGMKLKCLRVPLKKDIPLILLTTVMGHIIYYACEYTALRMIPVANVTVMLSLLPIATIVTERFLYGNRIRLTLIGGMIALMAGIVMTIWTDFTSSGSGKLLGYALCIGCIIAWVVYLFTTEKLTETYGSVAVALYQTISAFVLTLPIMLPNGGELVELVSSGNVSAMVQLLYLGFIAEGLCFTIEVTGLEKLGPTISAVYTNFLPVTTAFFGVILLGQQLVLLQYLGCAVVIAAGYYVIYAKERG